MSEAVQLNTVQANMLPAQCVPISVGWRDAQGDWQAEPVEQSRTVDVSMRVDERRQRASIGLRKPGVSALEITFAVPPDMAAYGGGERFETLNLAGQSVRFYLENFGTGPGTYLPIPWIATSLGYSVFLTREAPAVFHIAPSFDPRRMRIQVEADDLEIELNYGDLPELHLALIDHIGPPILPNDSFFGLWKAGDWRTENEATVLADIEGFDRLSLPMGVKLIDAYWSKEVHSFSFDSEKYPHAEALINRLREQSTDIYLWLCPWVVVGTASYDHASERGFTITDGSGKPIVRRPGANPNVQAALNDFSKPDTSAWWSGNLRALLKQGIAGFKADFGEQLPEHAVLGNGDTGGSAHNAFVRHYLQATIDAFDGRTPNIISRSGSRHVRAPIWTGDQTSDFCPKTGLPSAIRAVQSAALSGYSFVGSDLGGYFGNPTPQVFARWTQFACFNPLMMLHGLGCREPWDMDADSRAVFLRYARLHLALLPVFQQYGCIAADGGLPVIRMMPLAFPGVDWSEINDWDQQFMLGDDLLIAPVAFYLNSRAVFLPPGTWYDVLASQWVEGNTWRLHDVPPDQIPLFVREGAQLVLATDKVRRKAVALNFLKHGPGSVPPEGNATQELSDWLIEAIGTVGSKIDGPQPDGVTGSRERFCEEIASWFGPGITWSEPHTPSLNSD